MRLIFRRNRNDTCCVVGINTCTDTEINIPNISPYGDTVTSIGNSAFAYCSDIKSITIPDSVTKIDNAAFLSCTNLKSIMISDSVKFIGDDSFDHCTSLNSITIPKSVKRIGNGSFRGCTGLKSITIPDSVTSIGYMAFCDCDSLDKKLSVKATTSDMTCRGFQYEIGKWYHEDEAELCYCGFHYVKNAFDVFNYYNGEIGKDVRFFKVQTKGTSRKKSGDSKRVCTDICLYEEITSYKDLLN